MKIWPSVSLGFCLAFLGGVNYAQAPPPITSSGLNTQISARMLTISEAISLQSLPNRPASYQTGIYWTSTIDPASSGRRYYTINMGTGAVASTSDLSRYPVLLMVSN